VGFAYQLDLLLVAGLEAERAFVGYLLTGAASKTGGRGSNFRRPFVAPLLPGRRAQAVRTGA
jgi:hypothetical protein